MVECGGSEHRGRNSWATTCVDNGFKKFPFEHYAQ